MVTTKSATMCPGPLIWFDVEPTNQHDRGAVLECATCGFIVTTGNFHDEAHAGTPLLREGMTTS